MDNDIYEYNIKQHMYKDGTHVILWNPQRKPI